MASASSLESKSSRLGVVTMVFLVGNDGHLSSAKLRNSPLRTDHLIEVVSRRPRQFRQRRKEQ